MPNIIPNELYSNLNEFRLQNQFHDVTIKVGDRTFHCHRIILASASNYFRSMFSSNFREKNKKEIELRDVIIANDFELLLTYLYGGLTSCNVENVYPLLKIANYLCLQTLENTCVKYLLDNVDLIPLDTAIDIFIYARRIGKTVLLDPFAGFMARNFENASKSEEFLRVTATDLMKILGHHDLNKNSLVVLNFLERWVQFQSDEDKKLLPELLNAVDLKEIPKEWLVKTLTFRNTHSSQQNTNAGSSFIRFGEFPQIERILKHLKRIKIRRHWRTPNMSALFPLKRANF